MSRQTPPLSKKAPKDEDCIVPNWTDEETGRLINLRNASPDVSWEMFKREFYFPYRTSAQLEQEYTSLTEKSVPRKRARSEDDDGDNVPTRPNKKRSKSESNVGDSIQRHAFDQNEPIQLPKGPEPTVSNPGAGNRSGYAQQLPDQAVVAGDSHAPHRPQDPTTSTGTTSNLSQTQQEPTPPPNPAASTHAHRRNATRKPNWNSFFLPLRPAPAPPRAPQIPSISPSGHVTPRPQHGDAQQVEDILPFWMRRGSLPSDGNMSSISTRLSALQGIGESVSSEIGEIGRSITAVSERLGTVFGSESTNALTQAITSLNANPDPNAAASGGLPAGSSEVFDSQGHAEVDGLGGDGETTEDMGEEEIDAGNATDADDNFP
ncbi:uncharacterized protein APUU_60328A [Aspergillus puulaauensis]|uniref:Uncharacterized protein n=1 Tax=Aspergillus puulaauensis TaxID=1220207 RepID=A0A7R8AS29_9EURO|nr:uncharacterized protein APUU_60328A [Aspergillus puulaauensis]BCS27280.1 hypothetical protein APUU_60328A [Aspergillus puulaauensis]